MTGVWRVARKGQCLVNTAGLSPGPSHPAFSNSQERTVAQPKMAEPDLEGLDTSAPDGEEQSPDYVAPTPTKKQVATAEKVYDAIKSADIVGADNAVSALLQLIDVHPSFTPPDEWPGPEEDEYEESHQLALMADILCRGCPKLTVKPKDVVFLWRNKEKWMAGGKTVRGNVKKFPVRVRYLLDGKRAAVEINYHHWKTLNPLQRTFTLYHELRQLAGDGSVQKPDFTGFYDEMEVFGPRVFREMMELARVVEVGSKVDHQFQLSIFEDE